MNRTIFWLAVVVVCQVGPSYADYKVCDRGEWPKNWPSELEPLREQSRTSVGNEDPDRHFGIRFTDRDEFEAAWPHILRLKKKAVPLRLLRGPNFFLGKDLKAGVVIHCPPFGQSDEPAMLDLIVDGKIVDLNRIPLPADTPIVDERFKDGHSKLPRRDRD
jgi:hypothetical protein